MGSMTTGHEVDTENVITLPYASAGHIASRYETVPLRLVTFLLTCGSFFFAWDYIDTEIRYIGSWCGTPAATAEGILAIVSSFAIVESVIAMILTRTVRSQSTAFRPMALCAIGNLICFLTPQLWQLRVQYLPN